MANGVIIKDQRPIYHNTISTTTDDSGNAVILSGTLDGLVIDFIPKSGSVDANYNVFTSSATGHSYVHCSNFSTGAAVSGGTAVKGEVYYVGRPHG